MMSAESLMAIALALTTADTCSDLWVHRHVEARSYLYTCHDAGICIRHVQNFSAAVCRRLVNSQSRPRLAGWPPRAKKSEVVTRTSIWTLMIVGTSVICVSGAKMMSSGSIKKLSEKQIFRHQLIGPCRANESLYDCQVGS
jgi:hypothetical protein